MQLTLELSLACVKGRLSTHCIRAVNILNVLPVFSSVFLFYHYFRTKRNHWQATPI